MCSKPRGARGIEPESFQKEPAVTTSSNHWNFMGSVGWADARNFVRLYAWSFARCGFARSLLFNHFKAEPDMGSVAHLSHS